MAEARRIGLLAVGIGSAKGLNELKGAADDARRFAAWVQSQETFGDETDVKVLTDQDSEVTVRDVQDAARALIVDGGLDLLVFFFSGHGIVKSGGDEQVLLSKVATYPDEAISIVGTAFNARYIGVPHVVVISDACRNAVDPYGSLGQVSGRPAVQRGSVVGVRPGKVDLFFATEPSQPAKQHQGQGFFTRVLLDALNECPPDIYASWPGYPAPVILTWLLENHLVDAVPELARKQTPPFEQNPDVTTTAREPLFLGYAPARQEAAAAGLGSTRRHKLAPATPQQTRQKALVQMMQSFDMGERVLAENMLVEAELLDVTNQYRPAPPEQWNYPVQTGYQILGAEVRQILAGPQVKWDTKRVPPGKRTDVLLEEKAGSASGASIIVLFDTNTLAILPVLPGYVGTVQVVGGLLRSVAFETHAVAPSGNQTLPGPEELRELRAVAAALASIGKLRELARAETLNLAALTRQGKRIDPTLAMYAAYAYMLWDDQKKARSVYEWSQSNSSVSSGFVKVPVIFDIAMLAGMLRNAEEEPGAVAPFLPMLGLGWSMLDTLVGSHAIHPAVVEAGRRRLNAEWTTLAVESSHALLDAFRRGELR